jgi:hypothetical protein
MKHNNCFWARHNPIDFSYRRKFTGNTRDTLLISLRWFCRTPAQFFLRQIYIFFKEILQKGQDFFHWWVFTTQKHIFINLLYM